MKRDLPRLQRPSGAELGLDEPLGVRVVRRTHVRGIPFDLASGTQGDVAQQERLRELGGVGEVGEGLALAPAGVDPLVMVALYARDRRGGRLVILELRAR